MWDADMIDILRNEGAVKNPEGIITGEMTGPKSMKIGNLNLTAANLLFLQGTTSKVATAVAGHCPADGELKDKTTYLPALAAGDKVACVRLGEDYYLVLGKVVS